MGIAALRCDTAPGAPRICPTPTADRRPPPYALPGENENMVGNVRARAHELKRGHTSGIGARL